MSTLKTTNLQHPSAVDPAIVLDAAGKLWLAGGKVLQVVRATDSTNRSTTSSSFVDANLSVTISPLNATSAVLLIAAYGFVESSIGSANVILTDMQITDSSNNAISGAERYLTGGNSIVNDYGSITMFGYATPATTSATTYKVRFRKGSSASTSSLVNSACTAQLFAIEVSA